MARPTKGNELRASEYVGARVSEEMRQRLAAMAEANGRTLTDEARAAFEAHVARHSPFLADLKAAKKPAAKKRK